MTAVKKTFVVWVWNGESYDDSSEWIEAVMFSKKAAFAVITKLRERDSLLHSRYRPDNIYSVMEWQGEKLLATFNKDGVREKHV